ncbi:MAG TPA: homoserine dehydrogenase, partial [Roseiarcus sp.]|nr:homoserine dehydrogenase [Roseiarcus sp.]
MSKPLRVGVAGLGVVGASLVKLLQRQGETLASRTGRPIVVTAVSARDRARDRGVDLNGVAFFDDPAALAASDSIDLFVELIGGADGAAYQSVKTALERGRPVVTANKALIAKHGLELARLAENRNVALAFESSVAGGVPVIKTLREGLAGNSVRRIYGILNGTCNYILSKMETDGLSFEECLKEAQRLGYAEADPTFDVGGFDTAHKLAILASIAFGTAIDAEAIHVEGIETITQDDLSAADELGYRVKLLGVAERTAKGVEQRVHPTMVAKSTAIAQVMGVLNAVTIDADPVGELTLVGPGAGGDATASAVAADIVDIARGAAIQPFGRPVASLEEVERIPMQRHEGGYYVRLMVV